MPRYDIYGIKANFDTEKSLGAQVMGNIAELLLRGQSREKMSPEVLAQAEAWARKGLDIVTTTRKHSSAPLDVCEEAFAVLLYNVALVKEVRANYHIPPVRVFDIHIICSCPVTLPVRARCLRRACANRGR